MSGLAERGCLQIVDMTASLRHAVAGAWLQIKASILLGIQADVSVVIYRWQKRPLLHSHVGLIAVLAP